MKYIVLLTLAVLAQAEVVHSSLSTYLESKTFTNSKQKSDGKVIGVGADLHYKASAFKFAYEYGDTNTYQPPLNEDLKTQKLFLRYMYKINDKFAINVNYLKVLSDNIVVTDGGAAYGLGLTYKPMKNAGINFTQFYTRYDDFNVYQSDLSLAYIMKIQEVKVKFSVDTKYINLDIKNPTRFTNNAQNDYLTTGFKLHAHYSRYHVGGGFYMGKRVFGIMQDGFKIQHHAMEFDRTYFGGVGVNISDFVVRMQYIYQRATELPMSNENVEVSNVRLLLNYKI